MWSESRVLAFLLWHLLRKKYLVLADLLENTREVVLCQRIKAVNPGGPSRYEWCFFKYGQENIYTNNGMPTADVHLLLHRSFLMTPERNHEFQAERTRERDSNRH